MVDKTTSIQPEPTHTASTFLGLLQSAFWSFFYSGVNRIMIDGAVVGTALLMSYLIRFDGQVPTVYRDQFLLVVPYTILLYLMTNYVWGISKLVWHFIGYKDASIIAGSLASAALLFASLNMACADFFSQPRIPLGIGFLHPILTYIGCIGVRALWRIIYYGKPSRGALIQHAPCRRILLTGAGEAGISLLDELSKRSELEIVGFLDDSLDLQGRTIKGYPVLGTTQDLETVCKINQINEVILSMPSAPNSAVLKLATRCRELSVKLLSVPTLSAIVLGKVSISRLRTVRMEQLLGRESIRDEPDARLITTLQDRCVLVTGAGGSIGSELARQLRVYQPCQLILFDKDENSLHEIYLELQEDFPHVFPIVGNIRELGRTEKLFREWNPAVVFHAAAYKHVPLMESHPREAILNNIIGTHNLVDLANKYQVKTFVLISTDKAINPTSIMGASKRVAEMIVQQYASNGTRTRYCCVRFGNVLGSRASVVPLFQKQIRQGKNITVTHPDVQRYFMTIPEAVQLLSQACWLGQRGEVFLLDMGDPIKIVDLARNLIELSGLVPDRDIKIEFTGLRPGEKLFEELFSDQETGTRSTEHPKIFIVKAPVQEPEVFHHALLELEKAAECDDLESIQRILCDLNIGYQAGGNASQNGTAHPRRNGT